MHEPRLFTAQAIARTLNISDVRANLKPEDKITEIEELKRKYGSVVMVGDGINDAPALARATVGMAMGVAGTDAAIEAADTALMADDLKKVIYALELGKKSKTSKPPEYCFLARSFGCFNPVGSHGHHDSFCGGFST